MDIKQEVLDRLDDLPLDKQQEVLDFVEFLRQRTATRQQPRAVKGLWSDLDVHITEADISKLRQEMWSEFGGYAE